MLRFEPEQFAELERNYRALDARRISQMPPEMLEAEKQAAEEERAQQIAQVLHDHGGQASEGLPLQLLTQGVQKVLIRPAMQEVQDALAQAMINHMALSGAAAKIFGARPEEPAGWIPKDFASFPNDMGEMGERILNQLDLSGFKELLDSKTFTATGLFNSMEDALSNPVLGGALSFLGLDKEAQYVERAAEIGKTVAEVHKAFGDVYSNLPQTTPSTPVVLNCAPAAATPSVGGAAGKAADAAEVESKASAGKGERKDAEEEDESTDIAASELGREAQLDEEAEDTPESRAKARERILRELRELLEKGDLTELDNLKESLDVLKGAANGAWDTVSETAGDAYEFAERLWNEPGKVADEFRDSVNSGIEFAEKYATDDEFRTSVNTGLEASFDEFTDFTTQELNDIADYIDHLEKNPHERGELIGSIGVGFVGGAGATKLLQAAKKFKGIKLRDVDWSDERGSIGKRSGEVDEVAALKNVDKAGDTPLLKAPPNRHPSHRDDLGDEWYRDDGSLRWPVVDRENKIRTDIIGDPEDVVLEPGFRLDRISGNPSEMDRGHHFADWDTPYEELSLPYDEAAKKRISYEVIKPLPVEKGKIAPFFDQKGGGNQYVSKGGMTIEELTFEGYIRERK